MSDIVKNNSNIPVFNLNNNEEALELLRKIIKENDTILIKASHAMNFEEINNDIKKYIKK